MPASPLTAQQLNLMASQIPTQPQGGPNFQHEHTNERTNGHGQPKYRAPVNIELLPHHPKSLSGVSFRSFCLGNSLGFTALLTVLLIWKGNPLWRAPFFISALSLFHFLEYWTTAHYNTKQANIAAFLLSQNGRAYNIAHSTALLECIITNYFYPNRHWATQTLQPYLLALGLSLVVTGQWARSEAMATAGRSFNHTVQMKRAEEHVLVTDGIYNYLRHPSYFGYFYWALGTQLVLGNPFSFLAFGFLLWKFFSRRIRGR